MSPKEGVVVLLSRDVEIMISDEFVCFLDLDALLVRFDLSA
jgi:hypothetical protein